MEHIQITAQAVAEAIAIERKKAAAEIEGLREALDNSQSLLVAMLLEKRPESEIEDQIVENRAALNHLT